MVELRQRVEWLERFVFYSAFAFLAYKALLWLSARVPPAQPQLVIVLWGVGALGSALILGLTLGVAWFFLLQICLLAGNHLEALIKRPIVVRAAANVIVVLILGCLGIVYYEDSLAFVWNMIRIGGALFGLIGGNVVFAKCLSPSRVRRKRGR